MGLKGVLIVGLFGLLFGTDIGSSLVAHPPLALLAQAPGATTPDAPHNITVPVPSVFDNPGQLVLAVMYIIGTVINALITLRRDKEAAKREERNRQWQKEDAAAVATMAKDAAVAVAQVAKDEAEHLRTALRESKTEIQGSIEENTAISRTALDAANNVNAKIAAVGALRRSGQALRREADRHQDEDVLDEMHRAPNSESKVRER